MRKIFRIAPNRLNIDCIVTSSILGDKERTQITLLDLLIKEESGKYSMITLNADDVRAIQKAIEVTELEAKEEAPVIPLEQK